MSETEVKDTNIPPELTTTLPRITVDPSKHKVTIALHWLPIIFTGGVIPIVGFLCMHFFTNDTVKTDMLPWLTIFGAASLYSLVTRTRRLISITSTCRPIDGSRWTMDYFEWNFIIIFFVLTIVIAVASAKQSVRLASMGLTLLVGVISLQLILVAIARNLRMKSFITMSSVPRGALVRSACLVIAEDVVAVEANCGTELRRQLHARYDESPPIRRLFNQLDHLWGWTGLAMTGALAAVIWAVTGENGRLIGWSLGEIRRPEDQTRN